MKTMKKIIPFTLLLVIAFVSNVSATTVTTTKTFCYNMGETDCESYYCTATFAISKDQYAPNETAMISVDTSTSNPPLNFGCNGYVNYGSSVTGTPQPLTNGSVAEVTPGNPYSHAAPATPGNYSQSVSAGYYCTPGHPNCERDSHNNPIYTFPNFSEDFLPFSVIQSTECNDGVDNADTEDTYVDASDPGCHSDNNRNNGASYVSSDTSEVDSLTVDLHGGVVMLLQQLHTMFSLLTQNTFARK